MTWAWGAKPVDSADVDGVERQAELDTAWLNRPFAEGHWPAPASAVLAPQPGLHVASCVNGACVWGGHYSASAYPPQPLPRTCPQCGLPLSTEVR